MTRFVQSDRKQPFLMPPDLRDWVPKDDLVHFIVEAVARIGLDKFAINNRGTGSEQYHPLMMMALIVYCYSNGICASRRIEKATYRDVVVRFITANTHPDHDTICKFRRENVAAIEEAFTQVLELANELKILKVGTVSVDGTKIDANANKHKSIRYDRATELRAQLKLEVAELMNKAENADNAGEGDAHVLPKEIARREELLAKMGSACQRLEEQAKLRAEREREDYEKKKRDHEDRGGKGRPPSAPSGVPRPDEQTNLVDPDSRIMRNNMLALYRRAYTAQTAVDADGRMLILAAPVS